MGSRTSKEIECLARLEALQGYTLDAIMDFLEAEKLLPKMERKGIAMMADKPKAIQGLLAILSKEDKLSLLTYEWSILPVERIRISIITDRDSREFAYNL